MSGSAVLVLWMMPQQSSKWSGFSSRITITTSPQSARLDTASNFPSALYPRNHIPSILGITKSTEAINHPPVSKHRHEAQTPQRKRIIAATTEERDA